MACYNGSGTCINPLSKRQILFADDNFKFEENGRKFSKRVENAVEKWRNCSLRAISPFPTVFSKVLKCSHVKTGLVRERVKPQFC